MLLSVFRTGTSKGITYNSSNRSSGIYKDINKNIRAGKNVINQRCEGKDRKEGKWDGVTEY